MDENVVAKLIAQGTSKDLSDEKQNTVHTFSGMPETLARHFGHLFVRDPLVIIKECLHPTDEPNCYHFEVREIEFCIPREKIPSRI